MVCKGPPRLVPRGLCRPEQGPKRANELEPPQREGEQPVERAHERELLLKPPGLVEPPEQLEQGIDLPGQLRRVEQLSLGCGSKQPLGLLDPARDRFGACLEL